MSSGRDRIVKRAWELHKIMVDRMLDGEVSDDSMTEFFAALKCNNCGEVLIAKNSMDLAAKAAVYGWEIGENLGDADLCRRCAS